MQNEIPQDIFSSTQFGEAYKQNRSPLKWKLQRAFGPSGAIRTLGPVNPNHVRYQLRYTRIFSFSAWYHAEKEKASLSCLWAMLWSSPILREFFKRRISAVSYCPKDFRDFAFGGMDRSSILPKQARYQLRYPRIFYFPWYHTADGKAKQISDICGSGALRQKRTAAILL